MHNYDNLRERLILAISKGTTYQSIADIFGVNKGTIYSIVNNDNYRPIKPELRSRLGLLVLSEVECINGIIMSGSIAVESKKCPNDSKHSERWYIPNTSKRDQCYECEPIRKRKK